MALNLLCASPWFLFDCYQGLGLEVVLFGIEDSWLNNCPGLMLLFQFEAFLVGIGLEDALYYSIFGDISKGSVDDIGINDAFLFLGVIVGTGSLLASFYFTLHCFIVGWMVLLLLPAVAHVAVGADLTSAVIVVYVVLGLPVYARLYEWIFTIG